MTYPIIALQNSLVGAFKSDAQLLLLLGSGAVFDAPPKNVKPPYITIARHDVRQNDGDETPCYYHSLLFHCWHEDASRKQVLEIVERVVSIALTADLSSSNLLVTNAIHQKTQTMIDMKTSRAKAIVALQFFTEPV
jgi:hypothetical protein